jgi:radical SAM-linked protein
MSAELAEKISRVRKTGFTLAPEAATERMRAVINKGNREEDLLWAVESVFASGWSLLKLYFMIGLPEERDEDVVAIAQLAKKALGVARRSLTGKGQAVIHLGASTFVPKPFTPFQWEPMIPLEEIRRRQALITAELGGRHGAIQFKPHDPRQTAIEGALALGDRRVGSAILHAFARGQRLDGWTEWFNEQNWIDAFAECERVHGVGLEFFAHRRRPFGETLPWDRIDCGVAKSYLEEQAAAARSLKEVPDCVTAPCTACGVCDSDLVQNRTYGPSDYSPVHSSWTGRAATPVRTHIRVKYGKLGRLVALSHLETMHALQRAVRRAGLPIAYSQGFHPKPRVSFGPALPVGVESTCEYIDLELEGVQDPIALGQALAPQLPEGIVFFEAKLVGPNVPSLSESIRAAHYRADFPDDWSPERLSARIRAFEAAPQMLVKRPAPQTGTTKKRGHNIAATREKEIDLRTIVTHLAIEGRGEVAFSLKADPSGSAKPAEVLAAIFGNGIAPRGVKVLKEGVSFMRTAEDRRQAAQPRAPRYSDA